MLQKRIIPKKKKKKKKGFKSVYNLMCTTFCEVDKMGPIIIIVLGSFMNWKAWTLYETWKSLSNYANKSLHPTNFVLVCLDCRK